MSSLKFQPDRATEKYRKPRLASTGNEIVLRGAAVVILLGIAVMHFAQIVVTFQGTPLLGGAYLVLIAACVVAAGLLVTSGDRRAWTSAGVIGAVAIAGYLVTRIMSTPLDNQDVGNWSCMLGLAALFVEAALVAFSCYAMAAEAVLRGPAVAASVTVEAARRRAAA
jgi:uncharacterized membrane protein YeiB